MARPTTLPHKWLALAEAAGGIPQLYGEIGLSKMSFWRMAHGRTVPRPPVRKLIEQISARYKLPNPLEPTEAPHALDFRMLELIGDGLRKGLPPPQATLDHAKLIWPVDTLVEVAESDNATENVLRAATFLLEG